MNEEAIILVDDAGRIQFANSFVGRWWGVNTTDLLGDYFSNLFEFEVISSDPEWQSTQWMALRDTATEGPVVLTVNSRSGHPMEITLNLEKVPEGDSIRFLAFIRKSVVGDKESAAEAAAGMGATPNIAITEAGGVPGGNATFDLLATDAQVGFFDFDYRNARFTCSEKWMAILGFAKGELEITGSIWRELVHEEDSAAAPDAPSRKHAGQRRPFSMDFRMRTKSTRDIWVNCTGVQVLGREGNVERVAGFIADIQERKDFEELCLAAEERIETLGQQVGMALFDIDFENGTAWYSTGLARLLGFREGELDPLPAAFDGLINQKDAGSQAWFTAHRPGEPLLSVETSLVRSDKTILNVDLQGFRVFDRRKNLLRVTGLVSAAKSNASQLLGMPAPHLTTLLHKMAEGVIVTDAKGSVLFANAKACQLLRCQSADPTGKSISDVVKLVNRLTLKPAKDPITASLESGQVVPLNDEFSIAAENDDELPRRILFAIEPVAREDDSIAGVIFIFRDPDELTLTPDELVRSNRFETLGMLAGGIAHDFNNLLTTILGGVSLAREVGDYSQLEDSEKGCMTAKGLTRQLLSLARGGADMRQILNPAEVVSESVRLASVGTHVKVVLEVAEGLHMIHADRSELIRVLQNLVINSIQAIEGPGTVTIRAANIELNNEDVSPLMAGDYVQIQVVDTGCGIPEEHLQSIFEPFYTTKKTGTGLGLATVLSIVKTHGGQVGVDSVVGKGTTFSVFLPRADQPVAEIQRVAPTLRFGSGRILVMDDEAKILNLMGIMLESLEYKFDTARNGTEAIALYQRYLNLDRPYDVVILDLTIVGGMGGEDTFRELRRLDPNICAVISSGYDSDEMSARFMKMGFKGYLSKPYRVGELGKLLKNVRGNPEG